MIIDAEEERLFVISDLHLGNPSSTARSRLVEFLDYVWITGTSICINGDGFEMLQTSFTRLAAGRGASVERSPSPHARRQPRLLPRRQP